jgi:hypothetical protein
MTSEERERLNNLCKRIEIEEEQNSKVFNGLLEELNELLGESPEPIHRDLMPTHERLLRRAYCRLGNEFRPMIMRADVCLQCESCGS